MKKKPGTARPRRQTTSEFERRLKAELESEAKRLKAEAKRLEAQAKGYQESADVLTTNGKKTR